MNINNTQQDKYCYLLANLSLKNVKVTTKCRKRSEKILILQYNIHIYTNIVICLIGISLVDFVYKNQTELQHCSKGYSVFVLFDKSVYHIHIDRESAASLVSPTLNNVISS